jgi:hypothetical protein
MLPQPKPKPRASIKRANARVAAKIVRAVRAACVARDGYCRVTRDGWTTAILQQLGACQGESEWAHLEEWKRFKTRGKPAADRHVTMGTCMLCHFHHQDMYDKGKLAVTFLSERGADGPLAWRRT